VSKTPDYTTPDGDTRGGGTGGGGSSTTPKPTPPPPPPPRTYVPTTQPPPPRTYVPQAPETPATGDNGGQGRRRPSNPPPASDPPPTHTDTPSTSTNVPPAKSTQRTYIPPSEIVASQSAAGLTRDIPLGRCLQTLKKLYEGVWGTGNKYYFTVAAIGEGPIQKCTPRANRVPLTLVSGSATNPDGTLYQSSNGKISVWVYDGHRSAFKETTSGLNAFDPKFDTSYIAPGAAASEYDFLAFCVIRVEWDANTQTQVPTFDFDLEGYRDLFDSRDSTRKYSENRALWLRELITNTRWGGKLAATGVDDAGTWATAAADCAVASFPAQPAAPTLANGGAGNILGPGTHSYVVTRYNAAGAETIVSGVASLAIASSSRINVTVAAGDALTAGYNIYRAPNNQIVSFRRVGQLAGAGGGTFVDNANEATRSAGVLAPTSGPYSTKRFEGGGILISRQASGQDWLNTLRASCLGVFTWNAGKLEFRINQKLPGGYSPKAFSEFHSGGGAVKPNVDPDSIAWWRKPRHELFNEIEIRGTDIANDFAPFSIVKTRTLAPNELPRRAVYNLADVPDTGYAGLIGINLLNLAWDDAEFQFRVDRSGIACLPWDVISFTGAGLVGQLVRLRRIRGDGEGFVFQGTEYQVGSYASDIQAADQPLAAGGNPSPDPFAVPANPTGVTLNFGSSITASVYWTAAVGHGIRGYQVYFGNGAGGKLAKFGGEIPADRVPTVGNPLNVEGMATRSSSWNGAASGSVDLIVCTVSLYGVESPGVEQSSAYAFAPSGTPAAPYIPQTSIDSDLSTLGAGPVYNDVPVPAGPGTWRIIGPSGVGDITLTGVAGGVLGDHLFLFNSAGVNILISHNNAASLAGNRFRHAFYNSGAVPDLVIPSGATVEFIYDASASSGWRPVTGPSVYPAGATLGASPAAGDNSNKVATTAFATALVAANGGGLNKATSYETGTVAGTGTVTAAANVKGAQLSTASATVGASDTSLLTISGKGYLPILRIRPTAATALTVTILVDGVALPSRSVTGANINFYLRGAGVIAIDGASFYESAVPDSPGIPFSTSLEVRARYASGSSGVAVDYQFTTGS
jgi:hypothetical protein